LEEVVEIHRRAIRQSGGSYGTRDHRTLESSVFQPLQAFGDEDLYPDLIDKAAALGFFLIQSLPSSTATSELVMRRSKPF
jgi:death-on-curing protein